MNIKHNRVVITGLGAVSPIGIGKDAFWEGLCAGRSAVAPIEAFDAGQLPSTFGAEVKGFQAALFVKQRKSLKVMARDIQLAVAAAKLACDDAGLQEAQIDPARFGVGFGAGMICSDLDELGPPIAVSQRDGQFDFGKWGQDGMPQLFPLWLLKYLPNMLACHISIFHDAQGPNNTITGGEAASHLAIGEAARVISRGHADVMIAGGADSKITPLGMVRLCLLNALSRRNDEPERASRPFDLDRDGMVAGEAAGALVLEELQHARRRGAAIYGELCGFGASFRCSGNGPIPTDGRGVSTALSLALADAGIEPADVGLVMASGLSLPDADRAEAAGIRRVFDSVGSGPPVTALKSLYGNLGAGNGSVDLAAACLALKHGMIPATANFETPDPDCPLDVVHGPMAPLVQPTIATQAFTLAGQHACLVLKQCEG